MSARAHPLSREERHAERMLGVLGKRGCRKRKQHNPDAPGKEVFWCFGVATSRLAVARAPEATTNYSFQMRGAARKFASSVVMAAQGGAATCRLV
jgi:hypothetical protein